MRDHSSAYRLIIRSAKSRNEGTMRRVRAGKWTSACGELRVGSAVVAFLGGYATPRHLHDMVDIVPARFWAPRQQASTVQKGSVRTSDGQGPTRNASVICKRLVSLAECWSAVRLGSQSGVRGQHVKMNVCGRMTVPEAPNQACTYLCLPTLHMGQDRVRASIRCASTSRSPSRPGQASS